MQRHLSTRASARPFRHSRIPRHNTFAAMRTSIVLAQPKADALEVKPMRARQNAHRLSERDGVHANTAICCARITCILVGDRSGGERSNGGF